jgi:hypothetical protein
LLRRGASTTRDARPHRLRLRVETGRLQAFLGKDWGDLWTNRDQKKGLIL